MVTAAGNGGMDGLNAHLVFKLKYEGNGTVRLVLRLRNLQNCQLLEGEEVDTWFNRLETIIGHLTDLKEPVSDNRRLAHCLDALKGHEMLITLLDGQLAENKLTYDGLKTHARAFFNRRETTDEPKTALQTHARPCRVCHKLGHDRHECPQQKGKQAVGGGGRAEEGKQQRKKCSHCKKFGHDGPECRKRLAGLPAAGTNPSARVAQVEHFEAYVLMAQVPLTAPFSAAPTPKGAVSMMVDTGTSHHLVPTTASMTNVRPGTGSVKVANGHDMLITQVGSMHVHIVDDHGDKQPFKLDPVLVVPELGCPLFNTHTLCESDGQVIVNKAGGYLVTGPGTYLPMRKQGRSRMIDVYPTKLKKGKSPPGVSSNSQAPPPSSAKAVSFAATAEEEKLRRLHRRFGHRNERDLKKLAKYGVDVPLHATLGGDCDACATGKQHAHSFPKEAQYNVTAPGELVHMDGLGKITPPSAGGANFALLLTDHYTRWRMVYFLKKKKKSQVLLMVKQYKDDLLGLMRAKIVAIRTDNAGELSSAEFKTWCKRSGINLEPSAPYAPQQNGVAERSWRTVVEMARTFLADSGLHHRFWAEAVRTSVYLINRMPTRSLPNGKMPFEMVFDKKPDLTQVKTFGCRT